MDEHYDRYSVNNPDYEALMLLLANWPDAAMALDKQGRVVATNQSLIDLLKWQPNTWLRQDAHVHICPQSRELVHAAESCPFLHSVIDPQYWHSTFWRTAMGEYLSVDVRQTQLCPPYDDITVWSCIDNSEHRHNQAEYEKVAEFVDLSPSPIAEFDDTGQLLFTNTAMQGAMLDAGFDDEGNAAIFPANIGQLCEKVASSLSTGLSTGDSEFDSESGSESPQAERATLEISEQYWEWHFHKLESQEEQGFPSVLGFAFDITTQRQAQLALEESQAAARRDFYAKMIHELRTPLNAIIGFSESLLRRAQERLTEREVKHLTSIRNAGFQLNELVSDTLDISKIEAGQMSLELGYFNLDKVCNQCVPQMESMASAKQLSLNANIPEDIELFSDQQKFRQIIINLLSNAIKYTHAGSINLSAFIKETLLHIQVSDSGIGIPKEQLDKLFRSYQQIKDEQNTGIRGTGLGLALVEELVVMLGGRISVDSEYKKGSTFLVVLPLRVEQH